MEKDFADQSINYIYFATVNLGLIILLLDVLSMIERGPAVYRLIVATLIENNWSSHQAVKR